ncbi:MAG: ATP-binding protein [Bacteroidota bacterium]
MEKDSNPFLVTGYKGGQYFCDRESEIALLKSHIKNNLNTTIFSIRRLGKTGLIHHLFESYTNSRNIACIYLDILGTNNLKEFSSQLATAIYNRFPENKSIGKRIIDFMRSLRPVISYDDLSGQPELSFETGEIKKTEKTIQQLFNFLDQQNAKVIFAIDEFQQILEYPEKNTEALLRTYIQNLKNTHFIFCGSNQKMMHEIFNNAKKPFFASCSNMHLDFIDSRKYELFISRIFKQSKRKIAAESVSFVLEWTMRHTFYTQYFCNYLFSLNIKHIALSDVQKAAAEILKQNENTYYQYRNLLTTAQWNLLTAVAKETRLFMAHSKEFIKKYNLGTSSMVTRGIESLLEKEMIFHNTSVEKPYYEVYDKFLMRWLQHNQK